MGKNFIWWVIIHTRGRGILSHRWVEWILSESNNGGCGILSTPLYYNPIKIRKRKVESYFDPICSVLSLPMGRFIGKFSQHDLTFTLLEIFHMILTLLLWAKSNYNYMSQTALYMLLSCNSQTTNQPPCSLPFGVTTLRTRNKHLYMKGSVKGSAYLRK